MELKENKLKIYNTILVGVKEAIENNYESLHIPDLNILGDYMTFNLIREDWATVLERTRIFFEEVEEYDKCMVCVELKKKIA